MNTVSIILPVFRRVHPWVYEKTDGRVGHTLGVVRKVTTLLLYTTGRKSGLRRTTPLAYAPDGDGWIVVASNNGGERAPAWLYNVRADPRAEVRVARRVVPVEAQVIAPDDPGFARAWGVVTDTYHERFPSYQARTSRPIPVVRLSPAASATGGAAPGGDQGAP